MPDKMKWILGNIKTLSPHEKATLAHCLISSLDDTNEEHVDEAWSQIAERRFAQLESGTVKPVSWEEIKHGRSNCQRKPNTPRSERPHLTITLLPS